MKEKYYLINEKKNSANKNIEDDDEVLKFVYIPKSLSLISLTPLFDL